MNEIVRFNLRVYGIYIKNAHLLVTDEIRGGYPMTKLPGGGLEYGEGIEDCLRREWQEELKADVKVGEIFFLNRSFLQSRFNPKDQIVCMYFPVEPLEPLMGIFREKPMDFPPDGSGDQQIFRWVELAKLESKDFTFPTDQKLIPKLKAHFFKNPG